MTHPPNICPLANKASREAAVAGWKQIPSLAEKHGVKVLSFDHFDPEILFEICVILNKITIQGGGHFFFLFFFFYVFFLHCTRPLFLSAVDFSLYPFNFGDALS